MGTELRWVHCECCDDSGEVEVRPIVGPYDDPTPHGELCSACGGTGRDCVEVEPITQAVRRRVSALETQNGNLRAAFRANMLRYAPPDGVDAEIDRVLEWCSATGSYDFAPTDPHHGGKIWKP